MKINSGLFDRMVLQRTNRNVSAALVSGQCESDGLLTARITQGERVIKGFISKPICRVRHRRFTGQLDGIPVGGPYQIELRLKDNRGKILDQLTVRDVLVGDVWILAGQSNMQGIGLLKDALAPIPQVRSFYMNDEWDIAKDPLHNLWDAVDTVHIDLSGGLPPGRSLHTGVGPGVSFGQELFRTTGIPQGLIACAHGGTSMSQWDPALKPCGTKSLYGATIRRFQKNGGRVAGLVWYQGCSDTMTPDTVERYTARMKQLIRAFRRDFGNSRMPVAAVQLARWFGGRSDEEDQRWNSIREQQRCLPESVPHLAFVPAIDLSLDDYIHVSGADNIRLGKRLAHAMLALAGNTAAAQPPIGLRQIQLKSDPVSGQATIRVSFDHVIGQLQSDGHPQGFYLEGPQAGSFIYRADLVDDTAILRTNLTANLISNHCLYYGYGKYPYCNITDSADRSLPAFGPVPVAPYRALTDFVKCFRVSPYQPSAGKLNKLYYPKRLSTARFAPRTCAGNFCDLHPMGSFNEDIAVFLACQFRCSQAMKLAALFGYDGPFKAWIDGKEVYHDPKGANPAFPDRGRSVFNATAGTHKVLLALGSNYGKAWGIFLRFERLDVSPKSASIHPPALPVIT